VYQIALGAALVGAKQFGAAERELRDTLVQNEGWQVNHDLLWCVYHLLAKALEAEEKPEEAVSASKLALTSALFESEEGLSYQVMRSIAARDYASAVVHWSGSTDADRSAARRALNEHCSGPDSRFGVLAATLLEWMPQPDEINQIRRLLDSGSTFKSLRSLPGT
jgi:hypothetical protein